MVRRLASEDGETLSELRLAALTDSPDSFLGRLDEEAARSPEEWHSAVTRGVWFAAFADDAAAGLVSVVFDEQTQEHYAESMWVRPRRRGRGVATALLEAVVQYVAGQGGSALRLWVLDGNPSAVDAYQHFGFRPTGLRQSVPDHAGMVEEEFSLRMS